MTPPCWTLSTGGVLPVARLLRIQAPVLALAGERSPPFMRESAVRIAAAVPRGTQQILAGQTHDVAVEALAPVLRAFFGSAL